MNNKAALYLRQNPHRDRTPQRRIKYSVEIGTWESGKRIEIFATSVTDAINKAQDYCRTYDEVFRIWRDGKCIWDLYERMAP